MINSDEIQYDAVLIGSGPVFILEALYLSKIGKKVLIIDNNKLIGGSWAPIEFKGIKNIENAVHYLWNEKLSNNFLSKVLNIELNVIKDKYRIFFLFGFILKINYDSFISRIISILFKKNISLFQKIIKCKKAFNKPKSIYFNGGSPYFIKIIYGLIKKEKIEIIKNKTISGIDLKNSQYIKLNISEDIIKTKNLYISNSSRLPIIMGRNDSYKIEENIFFRPSLHILVYDKKSKYLECIFENNELIKYAHDITKYSSIDENKTYGKRIFVVALKSDITNSEHVKEEVIKNLINIGMLSKNVKIIYFLWKNFHLPVLSNKDLRFIAKISDNRIITFETETLSTSISQNSKRWTMVMKNI